MRDDVFKLNDLSRDYWYCKVCGFPNNKNRKMPLCQTRSKWKCQYCGEKYHIVKDNNAFISDKAKSTILLRTKLV